LPDHDEFCANVYSWTGAYGTPGGVLNLAGTNAMKSNGTIMAAAIRANPSLLMSYVSAFGGFPAPCGPAELPCHVPQGPEAPNVFDNVSYAFEAYVRRLDSIDAPFDRYVAGQLGADHITTNRDLIADDARRGLAIFIGKGMCVDCHRGPLLSDLRFHNTGVPQIGPRVPAIDGGLGTEKQVGMPGERLGEFLTPPLRHVAETAPYMHSGQFATLAEVIAFYRRGGETEGFSGRKDPRIQPLEITDDEARDLEAFLRTLTGAPISDALAMKPVL
jgi:cytochrome c peroxidase